MFLILYLLKILITCVNTFTGQYYNNYDDLMFKTSLIFYFKNLISGSFYSEREFLNFYTMNLILFPSGECVNGIVDNGANC